MLDTGKTGFARCQGFLPINPIQTSKRQSITTCLMHSLVYASTHLEPIQIQQYILCMDINLVALRLHPNILEPHVFFVLTPSATHSILTSRLPPSIWSSSLCRLHHDPSIGLNRLFYWTLRVPRYQSGLYSDYSDCSCEFPLLLLLSPPTPIGLHLSLSSTFLRGL
ncbi:hypothetical protein CC80DRAFT_224758 [Byssothecium circinans]|uniref:Uncharacterized protein n=1 Tax=Byssothecium circinans TaxID=147558 RepID=A0A6A5TD22_9PLEO|nr:hypothetical protein CC80DRAFT_224758 [Byssothecium circinans]